MERKTRLLFLPLTLLIIVASGLVFFGLPVFPGPEDVLVVFTSAAAFCSGLASQASFLLVVAASCLFICGVVLSLGFGVYRLREQALSTKEFVSTLLAARLYSPPRRAVPVLHRTCLEGKVDVVAAEQPFAFCYGFHRPRVCISTGLVRLLSSDELEAVLCHERYHLEQRHPLTLLLVRAFTAGLFYFPALQDLERHFVLWSEISADAAAVRFQGCRTYLASALYRLLSVPAAEKVPPSLALGTFDTTCERVDYLLGTKNVTSLRLSFSRLSVSLLSAGVLFSVLWWTTHLSIPPAGFCPSGHGFDAVLTGYVMNAPYLISVLGVFLACAALIGSAWRNYIGIVRAEARPAETDQATF